MKIPPPDYYDKIVSARTSVNNAITKYFTAPKWDKLSESERTFEYDA